ncbi:CRISPR-associated endoribonuclease Cas6 [Salisaeta longa]|uniref:CRISPR-associated endoribonuclease Cas6 n=1 Tax=Salisaeta longa TaxID=503170 RepID=UPI0003B445BC|nr:CRISPR-associated endoribonuclease Cas6 [Salisaeta longa]
MRLNLRLTGNTEPVPFNHLHRLTGFLHDRIGPNALHDAISLYSFGWLHDGQKVDGSAEYPEGHLTFPQGATWRVSFYDDAIAKRLMEGILRDPVVFAGMRIYEVKEQAAPHFGGCYRFKTDRGPVVARTERPGGGRDYLAWDNADADAVLTRLLRHKLDIAGLTGAHQDVTVQFDRTYRHAHTKVAAVKGVQHKGSICPVVVRGTPAAVRFAWLVGVGDLTGSGFGALR